MAKDPQSVLESYRNGVQAAGSKYKAGVQNPRRGWVESYTQSMPRMVAGIQRAISEGKPQAAAQRLGNAGYQQATLAKADRYAQSATRAAEGYAAKVAQVMQAATAGQNAAMQIEPTTWANRLQRVDANARAIARSWGKELE